MNENNGNEAILRKSVNLINSFKNKMIVLFYAWKASQLIPLTILYDKYIPFLIITEHEKTPMSL